LDGAGSSAGSGDVGHHLVGRDLILEVVHDQSRAARRQQAGRRRSYSASARARDQYHLSGEWRPRFNAVI
jgi:hypothetical protein